VDEAGEVDAAEAAAAVSRKRLLAALPGDQPIEDHGVAVGLGRIEDRFLPDAGDRPDLAGEGLGLAESLAGSPRFVFRLFRRSDETDFAHEAFARLALDDELVAGAARIRP